MKISPTEFIPEGLGIVSTEQDKFLIDYLVQTMSITYNLENNEGQKLFPYVGWTKISDNFASSIGPEKAQSYGKNIFLLYFNNTPCLARIEGSSIMALEPNTMEARLHVVKSILENVYRESIKNSKQDTASSANESQISDSKADKPKRFRTTKKKEDSK